LRKNEKDMKLAARLLTETSEARIAHPCEKSPNASIWWGNSALKL
jgi:hypothetical protein